MIRTVPIKQLVLEHKHFINPRTFTGLDDEKFAELVASIKQNGVIDRPKTVRIKSNGPDGFETLVWDGQRRVLASTKLYGPSHEIEVVDLSGEIYDLSDPKVADEIEELALEVGQKRAGLSSYELVELAERRRARSHTLSSIGKIIGKSESWVSRMLKAWDAASPKLRFSWKNGEVTDEQFKELAAEREQKAQEKATEEVVEARKSGDKIEARTKAKEIAEGAKAKRKEAKADKPAKKDAKPVKNGHGKADGEQQQLWSPPPKTERPKPAAPAKAVLEDMVGLADQKPPTHDYVKGVLDGARFALGKITADELAKPYWAYLARLTGQKPAKKSKTKTKKASGGKKAKRK